MSVPEYGKIVINLFIITSIFPTPYRCGEADKTKMNADTIFIVLIEISK